MNNEYKIYFNGSSIKGNGPSAFLSKTTVMYKLRSREIHVRLFVPLPAVCFFAITENTVFSL